MWQFILDMSWFGNAYFSLAQVCLSIGIVLATLVLSMVISSGNLKHTPRDIQKITEGQHAVAVGTISSASPREVDGVQYAYIHEPDASQTVVLTLEDDTGTIDIHLDAAGLTQFSDQDSTQKFEQGSTVYVRGVVSAERVFASTYYTTDNNERKVSTTVEISTESFKSTARAQAGCTGGMMLLLVILFGGYPIYKHYAFWQQPFSEVVVKTTTYRDDRTLKFDAWPSHLDVIDAVYDACPVGETVQKDAHSLTAWCGNDRQGQSIEFMSVEDQIWENFGSVVLVMFMGLGVWLTRKVSAHQ